MKKVTNKNTRRIAIAMPAATISASAAETAAIVEELPEVSTETTAAADIKEVIIENTEYKSEVREKVRVQNEKLLNMLKTVGKKAAKFGISKIPTVGSALEKVLDGIFGIIDPEKPAPVPLTSEEFANGIEDLKAAISENSNVVISDIEDAIKIANQDASFKRLRSQIVDLENNIEEVNEREGLSEDQKLLEIGKLVGDNFDNLAMQIGNFKAVTRATGGKDSIFQTMYHRYASNGQVMFAQEAKNKVQANVDYVYAYLLSGYTCIMECLNAQLYISGLSDKSGLSQRDLNKICDNAADITREMNTLTEVVFGTPSEIDQTYDITWFSDTEPEAKEGRTIEKQIYDPVTLLSCEDSAERTQSLYNEARAKYTADFLESKELLLKGISIDKFIEDYIASRTKTVYKVTEKVTETVEVLPEDALTGAYDAFNRIHGQTYIGEGLDKAVKLSPNMFKAIITSWQPNELTAILRKQALSADQIKKINDYAHKQGKTLLQLAKDAGFNVTDNDLKTPTFIPTRQEATDDRDWKANLVDKAASATFGSRTDLFFYFHGIKATDAKSTEEKVEYCHYKQTGGVWKYWKYMLGGNLDEYEITMSVHGNLFLFQNFGA